MASCQRILTNFKDLCLFVFVCGGDMCTTCVQAPVGSVKGVSSSDFGVRDGLGLRTEPKPSVRSRGSLNP